MAFTVYTTMYEGCDICRKVGNSQVFTLQHTSRTDKQTIYVHLPCLEKAIAKAAGEAANAVR